MLFLGAGAFHPTRRYADEQITRRRQRQARAESRLIVVSNRLPVSFHREGGKLHAVRSSGGLIGAPDFLLREHGRVWVGNAGTEDSPELHEELQSATREAKFHYRPIVLTEEEQAMCYEGFSNEVLWQLFHELQSRCVFNPEYWHFYQRVNRRFAEAIEAEVSKRDIVWVQDHQLMQVARSLRERRPHAFLSFSLHIPFPSPDIFGKLPWRRQVLEGLLEYDFFGLQTGRDERNLVANVRCYLPRARVTGRGDQRVVSTGDREVCVRAVPISIDFAPLQNQPRLLRSPSACVSCAAKPGNGNRHWVGSTRLHQGHSRTSARATRVFRAWPDCRRKITLIQVVVPSRGNIPRYGSFTPRLKGWFLRSTANLRSRAGHRSSTSIALLRAKNCSPSIAPRGLP